LAKRWCRLDLGLLLCKKAKVKPGAGGVDGTRITRVNEGGVAALMPPGQAGYQAKHLCSRAARENAGTREREQIRKTR
jgi:hypothetical protein